ncbi:hypothetical protein ACFLXJ_03430 [Chloroflexota bacterium]
MSEDVLVSREVIVLQETEAKRIGKGIRELCQCCGWSLTDFAQMADVPDDYLMRLVQGYELKVDIKVLDNLRQVGGTGS